MRFLTPFALWLLILPWYLWTMSEIKARDTTVLEVIKGIDWTDFPIPEDGR